MKILGIDLGTSNTYIYGAHKSSTARSLCCCPASAADGTVEDAIFMKTGSPLLIGHLWRRAESTTPIPACGRACSLRCSSARLGEENAEAVGWMTDFACCACLQDTLE